MITSQYTLFRLQLVRRWHRFAGEGGDGRKGAGKRLTVWKKRKECSDDWRLRDGAARLDTIKNQTALDGDGEIRPEIFSRLDTASFGKQALDTDGMARRTARHRKERRRERMEGGEGEGGSGGGKVEVREMWRKREVRREMRRRRMARITAGEGGLIRRY